MAIGVSGEVAEFMEVFHKFLFTNLPQEDLDPHLKEELGDIEFFMTGLCQSYGIFEEIMKTKTPLQPASLSATHLMSLLVVQSGNLLDITKKHVIYDQKPQVKLIKEEVAKFYGTLGRMEIHFGFNRDDIMQSNMQKLSKRYESLKYTNEDAKARKDKNE